MEEEKKSKDQLEEFVGSHRDEFDSFEPRPDLWQDISKELNQKKTTKVIAFGYLHLWKYAAAVLLLLTVGYNVWRMNHAASQRNAPVAVSLTSIAPEMAEVESYYTALINQKMQEQNAYDVKALGLDSDFKGEISRLDASYTALRNELATNPNKQKVIDAMVQNLQMRISMLNQQLEVLERVKKIKKSTQHEKTTI